MAGDRRQRKGTGCLVVFCDYTACHHGGRSSTPVSLMLRSDDLPLAIALGANLPYADAGSRQTLLMVRPLLTVVVNDWSAVPLRFSWSPLFDTTPIGGPPDQA